MIRTTKIVFDGLKRDWVIPEGFRTLTRTELESLEPGTKLWILGQKQHSNNPGEYVPAAYGPHAFVKREEILVGHVNDPDKIHFYAWVTLKKGKGVSFHEWSDGLLIKEPLV